MKKMQIFNYFAYKDETFKCHTLLFPSCPLHRSVYLLNIFKKISSTLINLEVGDEGLKHVDQYMSAMEL